MKDVLRITAVIPFFSLSEVLAGMTTTDNLDTTFLFRLIFFARKWVACKWSYYVKQECALFTMEVHNAL